MCQKSKEVGDKAEANALSAGEADTRGFLSMVEGNGTKPEDWWVFGGGQILQRVGRGRQWRRDADRRPSQNFLSCGR